MKFAICCLLAVCAFEAIFADQLQDYIVSLHDKSVKQINNIVNPLLASVKAEVQTAEKRGINTGGEDGCLGSSDISIKTYVDPRLVELDNCRDKATKDKNIKVAKSCYSKTVAGLAKEAQIASATAKACIQNCAHTDCSED